MTGKPAFELDLKRKGKPFEYLGVAEDGRVLVVAGANDDRQVWDLTTKSPTKWQPKGRVVFPLPGGRVRSDETDYKARPSQPYIAVTAVDTGRVLYRLLPPQPKDLDYGMQFRAVDATHLVQSSFARPVIWTTTLPDK